MNEYLAFTDDIGRTIDGGYIYRLDFTIDTDTVWGEYFNVAPAAIIPDLQPDINCITTQAKVNFPREMITAKRNYCFSMQDCIDGIIPLMFCEIDSETIEYDEKPIYFNFGEDMDSIKEKLKSIGLELYDIEEVAHGDEGAIDAIIGEEDDDGDNNGDDENF